MPKSEREMQGCWRWLGKTGVRLNGEKIIYIDPISVESGAPKADLILLTHGHEEHFSPADVTRAAGPQTIVAGPAACIGLFRLNQLPFEAGESRTILGVSVTATPAYGLDNSRHPKSAAGLGYLIDLGGMRIFHAGDTAAVPELRALKADAGFLPVGPGLMSAREASALARDMGLRAAAPTHIDPGSKEEQDFFAEIESMGIAAWAAADIFSACGLTAARGG